MPYKILHLVTTLGPGGIERWLLDMLRQVNRERYAMDFCCKGASVGQLASEAEALGAKVWHNPLHWTHIGYGLRLRRIIQCEEYDLIHNHLTVCAGFPAYIARQVGAPSIASFHSTTFETKRRNQIVHWLRALYARVSIRVAARMSQAVTGCSQGVLDALEHNYQIDHRIPRRVIYYGVDIPRLADTNQRLQFRCELGVPEQVQIVVHVGRFGIQKNHAGLVRIAQQVLQVKPATCFVLVGEGQLRHNIEEQVKALGLEASFRFLGIRRDVERILTCCDLLLFPSLWEGFGLVALEANAAGIPVVGSDVPGLREAVEDGKTGILCPPDDEPAFVEAVCQLLDDQELRRSLGQNGVERVRTRFSKEKSAQALCQLYDSCLGQDAR